MSDIRATTIKNTELKYDGYFGTQTAIALIIGMALILIIHFGLHLPPALCGFIGLISVALLRIQLTKISFDSTSITITQKPLLLFFYPIVTSILLADIQSWNAYDIDRGTKSENHTYMLRITTSNGRNYKIGLELHGKLQELIQTIEPVLSPEKQAETQFDINFINRRQTSLVNLKYFAVAMLITGIIFTVIMFIF